MHTMREPGEQDPRPDADKTKLIAGSSGGMNSCEYAHERPTLTEVVTRVAARARYLGGMWRFALPALASAADDLRAALDRCSGALHPLPTLSAEQRGAL